MGNDEISLNIKRGEGLTQALKRFVEDLKKDKLNSIIIDGNNISQSEWNDTMDKLAEINNSRVSSGQASIFSGGTDKNDWKNNFVVQEGNIKFTASEMGELFEAMGVEIKSSSNPAVKPVDNNKKPIASEDKNVEVVEDDVTFVEVIEEEQPKDWKELLTVKEVREIRKNSVKGFVKNLFKPGTLATMAGLGVLACFPPVGTAIAGVVGVGMLIFGGVHAVKNIVQGNRALKDADTKEEAKEALTQRSGGWTEVVGTALLAVVGGKAIKGIKARHAKKSGSANGAGESGNPSGNSQGTQGNAGGEKVGVWARIKNLFKKDKTNKTENQPSAETNNSGGDVQGTKQPWFGRRLWDRITGKNKANKTENQQPAETNNFEGDVQGTKQPWFGRRLWDRITGKNKANKTPIKNTELANEVKNNTKSTFTDATGARIQKRYNNNKEYDGFARTKVEGDGTVTELYDVSGSLKSVSKKNSFGRKVSEVAYDTNGKMQHMLEFEYNAQGKTSKIIKKNNKGKTEYTVEQEYNDKGQMIKSVKTDCKGNKSQINEFIYNENKVHNQGTSSIGGKSFNYEISDPTKAPSKYQNFTYEINDNCIIIHKLKSNIKITGEIVGKINNLSAYARTRLLKKIIGKVHNEAPNI